MKKISQDGAKFILRQYGVKVTNSAQSVGEQASNVKKGAMNNMSDVQVFPEAPAVINIDYKRKDGFVVKLTLRDATGVKVLERLEGAIKRITDDGGVPYEKTFAKKEAKPIDYVADRVCPKCKEKLVYFTTKTGKKGIKCSTNKWNYAQQKAEGCDFTEWEQPKPEVPEKDIDDY